MVDKIIPFLINVGDVIPARSKATLLDEMAMALNECINIYGKSLKKLGKINRISMCFWPVRLVPLNETRACVCSYLLNKQEKLSVGKFSQTPPNPDNIIQGADPTSFLSSLASYNSTYLKKTKNYKRGTVIQEALFSASEVDYFKNFFLNQYNIGTFSEPYFLLEGGPIPKSINQAKIVPEVFEFISQRDVGLLDSYGQTIIKLCDRFIQKGSQETDRLRSRKVDTSEEEKQLAQITKELEAEKARKIEESPEELVKSGKYKMSDKTGDLYDNLSATKNSVDRLKNAVNKNDLFEAEGALNDVSIKYTDLGNTISRYQTELAQIRKNVQRELSDLETTKQQKIKDLERKKAEVESKIQAKHSELSSDLSSAEDIVAKIKEEKQSCLDNIEKIKDIEMTAVQNFLKTYSLEIKTIDVVVGVPMFIFYFIDPNTRRTTERAPVFPILIEGGKIHRTKVTDAFRTKLRDLMNKDNAMINLVEKGGETGNLMEFKNLDTQLEEAINDLRIRKILGKKEAERDKEIIYSLVW
ncbi:MAG: coiled-coil domain-containing protein [Candidatus Hermodarchaeota archaeon]